MQKYDYLGIYDAYLVILFSKTLFMFLQGVPRVSYFFIVFFFALGAVLRNYVWYLHKSCHHHI